MIVGVLLIIASIGSDFSQRGTVTGQGLIQLFGYSAPLAIAVGLLNDTGARGSSRQSAWR